MSETPGTWVVIRAIHPSWCTLQVPGDVAELLGCRPEDLEKLTKPARAVAFLDRGPGVLRVIGVHRSADLLAKEMAMNRVVGTAQLTDKGVFNLPDAVETHLGLSTFPRGDKGASGTDDSVAWLLPEKEYYEFREGERQGKGYGMTKGDDVHLYLVKSLFPGLLPSIDSMEREHGHIGRAAPHRAVPRKALVGAR
jgi:hypothetical protein